MDDALATDWLVKHFHPDGLKCPHCEASVEEARSFRQTTASQLTVYRCLLCNGIYNLYSSTVFQQRHLTPSQAVLLLRGVYQGVSTAQLARELGLSYPTVLSIRHALEVNANVLQPAFPLADDPTETDEMFQNAREKK